MALAITIAVVPTLLLGVTALCACLSGCCCADRAALTALDGSVTAELTSSVPSAKVS